VLVYLHGGGYFSGSKRREGRAMLHRLAEEGWVCVSATYRLRPQVQWPDHLVDAKRVLAWVRRHAGELGADPARLVMAGSSAGAHLTAVCALSANEAAWQPGFEDDDTSVAAAVCLYGWYGAYYGRSPEERPSSSPLHHDAAHAPPFFLAHGDRDGYTPVSGVRALHRKLLAESSAPVVYAELPGAQHGFDLFRSLRSDAVVAGVEEFAARVLRAPRTTDRSGAGR
jgi:acetyl esterase/lipase